MDGPAPGGDLFDAGGDTGPGPLEPPIRRLNYPDIENLTTCFHMTGALRPDRGGRSTPTTGNNTRCCVMP